MRQDRRRKRCNRIEQRSSTQAGCVEIGELLVEECSGYAEIAEAKRLDQSRILVDMNRARDVGRGRIPSRLRGASRRGVAEVIGSGSQPVEGLVQRGARARMAVLILAVKVEPLQRRRLQVELFGRNTRINVLKQTIVE